jgi:hypothetical protein
MGLVDFDYFLTCARDFRSEPISWTLWCWWIAEIYYKKLVQQKLLKPCKIQEHTRFYES